MKTVLIIGATGGTGRELVKQALARGYSISVLIRNPAEVDFASEVRTFTGDVLNVESLKRAVSGQDAVISSLGSGATGPFRQMSMLSQGTRNLISAMQSEGVKRLICITGIGAGESKGYGPWYYNLLIQPLLLRGVYEDKTRQEQEVKQSGLDWTIVRPSTFTDNPPRGAGAVKSFVRMKDVRARTIGRSDVARFCLDELETGRHQRQAPVITF